MSKKLVTLFLILFTHIFAYACYQRTFLPNLIENSDIIIWGEIVSITKKTFTIDQKVFIKNRKNQNLITIQRFQNWECDRRFSEYKIGQEAIYFIEYTSEGNLRVMGAANEGELVVQQNIAFVHGRTNSDLCTQNVEFMGEMRKFCVLNVSEVIEGIKIYLDNLNSINKVYTETPPGTITFTWFGLENLPQNDFLKIILEQKSLGLDRYR